MERQEYENIKGSLPPGPWYARGNTIFAGTDTVAVVFARGAAFVANQIAKYPERLEALFDADDGAAARIAALEEKLEALEEERDDLKVELETARDEAASLRADLTEAQNALDDKLAGK
jgi:septal ring factor EnvC (AmiA/AmiB activator)